MWLCLINIKYFAMAELSVQQLTLSRELVEWPMFTFVTSMGTRLGQ